MSKAQPRLSRRGEIRLGFRCNARCGFCYYQDKLDTPKELEPTTEQLTARLRLLRKCGATEVEFTGGEPTIRSDLPQLAMHARKLGFVNISVINNGLRLANLRYAKSLVEAGVNDFLFSIHGHTADLHDRHTRIPGSFKAILLAMDNVRSLGRRCRTTTTVTSENVAHVEEIVQMLLQYRPDCMHLAVFSPVAEATSVDNGMAVRYSDAAASIRRAIDRFKDELPPLSVKYIPFCFMQGYEQYVMNLYQQSFDPDDWNYYYSNKVRRADTALKRLAFDGLVSMAAFLGRHRTFAARNGALGLKVLGLTRVVELLRKCRAAECRRCRYDSVCDHLWKGYRQHFGDSEIVAVKGPRVTNPVWCYDMARTRAPGSPLSIGHNKSETGAC